MGFSFLPPLPSAAKINCTIPLDMIHGNTDAQRYTVSASAASYQISQFIVMSNILSTTFHYILCLQIIHIYLFCRSCSSGTNIFAISYYYVLLSDYYISKNSFFIYYGFNKRYGFNYYGFNKR